jgi:predicted acylesterase/phospholipase RssA
MRSWITWRSDGLQGCLVKRLPQRENRGSELSTVLDVRRHSNYPTTRLPNYQILSVAVMPRIAVVLSAGGLRGAAHVGVLRQLQQHGIPVDALVGVSAGAVIAAYYAAVGLSVDELIDDAARFRGRHLLTHSLNVQSRYRYDTSLKRWCGVIPDRLHQLESASFERLHHGIRHLGIVCHDTDARRARYFSASHNRGPALSDLVRASASIPHLFPTVNVTCQGGRWRLTDGGVSDPVPLAFARELIDATHVIVSDCRWIGRVPAAMPNVLWLRPRMTATGTLWSPRRGLVSAVSEGEAAVTSTALETVERWFGRSTRAHT